MNNELVSIIVLSYKNLQYIEETIDSILMQDYENIELIIGDDSTENFDIQYYKDYIEYHKNKNIKNIIIYTNDKNVGIVKNANKAINMSKGKYIKFIAADDSFYNKDVISKMIEYMSNNNSLILTTNMLMCDSDMNIKDDAYGNIERLKKNLILGTNPDKFFKRLSIGNFIPAPGVMFSTILFDKFGKFDENYVLIEDWNTWLRLSRQGVKFDYLDIISIKYRGDVGVSSAKNPNPLFIKDHSMCIEKEILPYKKELGYWFHKKANYKLICEYKYTDYSLIKKIAFLLANLDIVLINQIKKLKLKLNRSNNNEN